MVSPFGRTLDRGSEVRRHAHLLEHDVERGVAVESLLTAVGHAFLLPRLLELRRSTDPGTTLPPGIGAGLLRGLDVRR